MTDETYKAVEVEPYEGMKKDELIACCYAHDAHHKEHHEREASLLTRCKELEERLEISPDHKYDGIACRDETIRQLEVENEQARGLLDSCLNGLNWRADNPLEGWDESDGEMALEIKQFLQGDKDNG